MVIEVIVYGTREANHDLRAVQLLSAVGANKFGGSARLIEGRDLDGSARYRFDVPQAFTAAHPAIAYIREHA